MAIDINKDLNIDETRTVLQGLKDAGVFNSQEQIGKNLARFQKTNSTTAVSPTDVSGSPRYEIPDSTKSNKTSNASQNITAGAFDFSNYVSKLGQDTVNQQDINKGNSSMVQGLLDKIGGKQSKGDMKSDIRSDVESETGYNVADLTMQAEEYQGQLDAEQRAFEVEKRRLLDNPSGLVGNALQDRINIAERHSLQKQADIAILGNFAANKLDKAQTLINDRLDLEYGDQKQEIDDYMTMVSAVSGLSNDVKTQLKESAKEEKDAIQQKEDNKRELFGLAQDAAAAGNLSLAKQFMSLSNQDITEDTIQSVRQQSIAAGVSSPSGTAQTLSILDVERYQNLYPDLAGQFLPGMSASAANNIISTTSARNSDIQIKSAIDQLVADNTPKAEIIQMINDENLGQSYIDYANTLDYTQPVKKTAREKGASIKSFMQSIPGKTKDFITGDVFEAADTTNSFFGGLFN